LNGDSRCIFRGISYADLKTNVPICESYVSAMRSMGYHTIFDNSEEKGGLAGGSTDMGSFPCFDVQHMEQITDFWLRKCIL
jgi:hypothetical protein